MQDPDLLAPGHAESSSRSSSRPRARTDAHEHRSSMWDPLKKIGSWLRRDDEDHLPPASKASKHADEDNKENGRPHSSGGLLHRRSSRRVVPGLPRPLTFKRMNSEKREKLLPVPVDGDQRRAASADRRGSRPAARRTLSPPPVSIPSISAPDVLSPHNSDTHHKPIPTIGGAPDSNIPAGARQVDYGIEDNSDFPSMGEPPPLSAAGDSYYERGSHGSASDIDEIMLQEELEAKWILNLSMHFRDRSDREKFFVTYAEEPNKWRRVTVSCDYRNLSPDSLEADLKSLHYQRDKSSRIYEAIRDSLPDIQFYDTVTNLKLQTADGRLHVHVTEDVNEIIPYPSLSAVDHLPCKKFKESAVSFDSHISGFVYKVSVHNKTYIKKEIPGPDAVEEFLYEINALCQLQDSNSVIQFEGIIVDEKSELIKGLIISYAEQGALVDVLYDYRNTDHMLWRRREKWARQIVEGLSEIHEAGFVQGDFTLSNIVIDHHDNAKIIDINRRGCPVGWEPPELARLIESGQRISIYIGVKSDLFQLGMVLWALAEQHDEPERQERPLMCSADGPDATPQYFRDIVKACLSDNPRDRPAARTLLAQFPEISMEEAGPMPPRLAPISTYESSQKYIDERVPDDFDRFSTHSAQRPRSTFSNIRMPSTEYIDSADSYVMPEASRGRSPSDRSRSLSRTRPRSDYSPYPGRGPHSIMSLDDSELENEPDSLPASRGTRWEQIYVDGDTKLYSAGPGTDPHDFTSSQDPKDVCITAPPAPELCSSFMESKKSEEACTPLSLSTVAAAGLHAPQASDSVPTTPELSVDHASASASASAAAAPGSAHVRQPSNKASFSDRIHNATAAKDAGLANSLADLENEVGLDGSVDSTVAAVSSTTATTTAEGLGLHRDLDLDLDLEYPPRFTLPLHQDSGFAEGVPVPAQEKERMSFESERIRQSLDDSMADLKVAEEAGMKRVEGRLWDEREGTMIMVQEQGIPGPDVYEQQHQQQPPAFNKVARVEQRVPELVAAEKPLEEKVSSTTIRPPSLVIPEFHHGVPLAVGNSDSKEPVAVVEEKRGEVEGLKV